MFLVSGPELVIESCRSGLIGSFPTQNARTFEDLVSWLGQIRHGLADVPDAQWAVSMIVHPSYDRFEAEFGGHRLGLAEAGAGSGARLRGRGVRRRDVGRART
jgi:hypothetical protein